MGLELATVGSCQKRDETPMNTGERDASTHASLDPKELFPWRKGYLSKGTFLDLTLGPPYFMFVSGYSCHHMTQQMDGNSERFSLLGTELQAIQNKTQKTCYI